jgi:exonuclease SbcD
LEPKNEEGRIVYETWSLDLNAGGYIDVGRARIFGSHWYGASANWAIPMLTEAIRENYRAGAFHLLMLHTDVEGHQTHPIPALSISALKKLREVTDYVALGHTHMHYEIDNWAFNPGSIEVTNIAEYRETRGVFVADVSDDNEVSVRHLTDYTHRPFQRLTLDVTHFDDPKAITEAALEKVRYDGRRSKEGMPAPILEISLTGQLGFPASQLELKKIRDESAKLIGALHVRLRNVAVPTEYATAADTQPDIERDALERQVVEDLIARDKRFRTRVPNISQAVIGAKQQALLGDDPEKIANFIAQIVNCESTSNPS